jgi:hypothetical protein
LRRVIRLPAVARLRVAGLRWIAGRGVPSVVRRRVAQCWVARRWVCGGRIADRRVTAIRVIGRRRAHLVEPPSRSIMVPILSTTGAFLNVPVVFAGLGVRRWRCA